jgi:pilus assembly protein CpaC
MKNELTGEIAGLGRQVAKGLRTRRRTWLPRAALVLVAVLTFASGETRAQTRIALANQTHTTTVAVVLGKSEDVHTDQRLVDIAVGDPGVADVNPLTDHALSILGKKIGTTRVTVYGEDKKPVGIFDVEVAYDISRLAAEIAHLSGGGIKVSSVNGRIMLSGMSPDAVTLDKAVTIARQFVPDPIDTVQVMQAQEIMLEVRFIEASRNASRELGVQWNVFGSHTVANIGSQQPALQLPITTPGGAFQQPGAGVGGYSVLPPNVTGTPLSPVVAAGVLSGSSPFGFLVSQLGGSVQMQINALEQRGLAAAWQSPIWWHCRVIRRASSPAANSRSPRPTGLARSPSPISPMASACRSRRPSSGTA